jgi:nicotinate-nucleotide pyrophosphorylase (carboxylating)
MNALPDPPRPSPHDPIAIALAEDIGPGDLTSRYFAGPDARRARIFAKEAAVVAGADTAAEVFLRVDPSLRVRIARPSGCAVEAGETVIEVSGAARSILTAERVALNFIQRLSGIATLTRRYVEAVAGTDVQILDTRKTTPGLRALEKAAVAAGGGRNHRFGLYDMVMIKDNHLLANASWAELGGAIERFRAEQPGIRIEVEADDLSQVEALVKMEGIDVILLDNMGCEDLSKAVAMRRGQVRFEASGGVSLETVGAIARTGVDFISVGALTHSAAAIDFSLELLA